MGKLENVLAAVLRGTSDNNFTFAELRYALEALGFAVRIKGDHFIGFHLHETEHRRDF